jgi:6-pyruvoyltetrahydropterin/6-carboxytetrahydropterin synthase
MLSELIKKEVLDKFDHQNLNLDTAEFKELNPSAENIARVIFEIIQRKLDSKLELQILLAETENNIVQYPA